MNYQVGSLVKARGREWVVLPQSEEDFLLLRPLGGTDEETTGICLDLETVEPASFDLPDPTKVGDYRSCRLLRDAVRLSTRSCAGPFRSFGRLAVDPRPYQLVPLLMSLKLDPVRLLIADDVGIGKTIEAGLVARELLDRGEIERIAVLCPPHLAEQWQEELSDKFHIDAEVVLAGTAAKLERYCRVGQSLFDIHKHVIISMDFIKSDRRRDEFIRACPEFVIIDEAHTCAFGYQGRGGRHQRYQLVSRLAEDNDRHIVLVTATPHSGKEESFRSLLSFLNPDFAHLPQELTGQSNEHHRRRLAAHFVQRRRADIRHFMQAETPFPTREERENTYKLSDEFKRFFERVLKFTRETISASGQNQYRQRVSWWSALALLRAVGSSPAAAAMTLRNRSATISAENIDEIDEVGRRTVLDVECEEQIEGIDIIPGSDVTDETEEGQKIRRRLLQMAREAEALQGKKDSKLLKAIELVKEFLNEGYRPIIFCRFIPTAEYLAEQLRTKLSSDIEVISVTGLLPPAEREARVSELARKPKRVLVCTDCLSEGINLQEHFDAAMHYDLSWSPTRHEQREGRIDRYGQPQDKVRVLTYYGIDNPIDGIVLDVLIKKHKKIKSSLGISVPVPVNTDSVIEAIFEGVLFRQQDSKNAQQMMLPGFDDYFKPKREDLYAQWENAAEKEKRSRTVFAQESIKVDEVARELEETSFAIGSTDDVVRFVTESLSASRAVVNTTNKTYRIEFSETPRSLRDALSVEKTISCRFEKPVKEGVLYLHRTHPFVENLSSFILDTSLDPIYDSVARRAGAIRTNAVTTRTTLLLVRFRYDIITKRKTGEISQLAEEATLLAFQGSPANATWIDTSGIDKLIDVTPDANIAPEQATGFINRVIEGYEELKDHIEKQAHVLSENLLESHRRVRTASGIKGISYKVLPQLPPDILGIYVYLPAAQMGENW